MRRITEIIVHCTATRADWWGGKRTADKVREIKRWMVMVGSSLQIIQFCALGYSAWFTGGEPIIGVYAIIFFASLYAYILGAALNDT